MVDLEDLEEDHLLCACHATDSSHCKGAVSRTTTTTTTTTSPANDDSPPSSPRPSSACALVLCNTPQVTSTPLPPPSSSQMRRRRALKSSSSSSLSAPPPIGVYWDIENCQVPRARSAFAVVQRIREVFFDGHSEAEFITCCDVRKESAITIQELHDAQVTILHVNATSKNAADDKLREMLRRFGETYEPPATAVLISGDINFASEIATLRYRRNMRVVLIHNFNASPQLKLHACETYLLADLTATLPDVVKNCRHHSAELSLDDYVRIQSPDCIEVFLFLANLPTNSAYRHTMMRLKTLAENCGGRIIRINTAHGTAVLVFASLHHAIRARRRLFDADVYGKKVVITGYATSETPLAPNIPPPNDFFQPLPTPQATKMLQQQPPPPQPHQPHAGGYGRRHHQPRNEASFTRAGSQNCSWSGQAVNRSHNNTASDWGNHTSFTAPAAIAESENPRAFQPIAQAHVELVIANLDTSLRDLRTVLGNLLKQHAVVYNLTINYNDAKPTAHVKVANQHNAEYLISKIHHQKLGARRISVSYAHAAITDLDELRDRVVDVLAATPTKSMPLYMLVDALEKRYLLRVSLCEINKLRDTCAVYEEHGERIAALVPEAATHVSPPQQRPQLHYCYIHCPNGTADIGDVVYETPHVHASLAEFAEIVNKLLTSHMGTLPLLSFHVCYRHEFGKPLRFDTVNGVPLEHLVTCLDNVRLQCEGGKNKAKHIVWETTAKTDELSEVAAGNTSAVAVATASPLAATFSLLRREFVDLLKNSPKCQIPLGRFVPAFHHHFGRQLRVADYGYPRLDDLLHSPHLSNVIQILGDGSNRTLTLSHGTQMRRFTNDLRRALKAQPSKQITAREFADVYTRTHSRPFAAAEYGLCTLEDLLDEVAETDVVVTRSAVDGIVIGVPRRMRTTDEMQRTRKFADEVVKLLSHAPGYSVLFDKFVPHYHHHFGHQCKVSDYGFGKLIELFEAIPDVARVEELANGQRKITLTPSAYQRLVGNRLVELIKKTRLKCLPLAQVDVVYQQEYKTSLGADPRDMIAQLEGYVTVACTQQGPVLVAVPSNERELLSLRIWTLLMQPPHTSSADKLIFGYVMRFRTAINIDVLEKLNNIILYTHKDATSGQSECMAMLTPAYVRVAKLYALLHAHGGHLPFSDFETIYECKFGERLLPYGEDRVHFLAEFAYLLVLCRCRGSTRIALNPHTCDLLALPMPSDTMGGGAIFNWPPKPDTPPVGRGSCVACRPRTPSKQDTGAGEFCIPMPAPDSPKVSSAFVGMLVSPTRHLLPANPSSTLMAAAVAAAAAAAQNVDEVRNDESADSGVSNSQFASDNEMEASKQHASPRNKAGGKKTAR